MTKTRRLVALVLVVVAAGCGSSGPARGDVLADLADEVIMPSFVALEDEAATLVASTRELCDELSPASVDAAREALASTRAAWLSTEAVWAGPVMERRSWAVVDWPVSAGEIEELIADESIVLDIDRLSRRIGADQRGLRAVEYILGPTSDSPLPALESGRRCAYLAGIAEVIHAEVGVLVAGWATSWDDGPAYREQFVDVANGGLDTLVNDALFLLEAMTDAELGAGLGLMGDPAAPDSLVEGPAGLGIADLASRTAGLRLVLIGGTDAAGIAPLLPDDLVERLDSAFARAETGLAAADGELRTLAGSAPATIIEIRDGLTEVQVLLATEVVSTLGVTIGFSDADGDSG